MEPTEFIAAVVEAAKSYPDIEQTEARKAARLLLAYGPRYRGDIGHALQLARRIAAIATAQSHGAPKQLWLPPTPTSKWILEWLSEAIQPKVEEIRLELFGTKDSPFPPGDEEAAVKWIEEQAEKEQRDRDANWASNREKIRELKDEVLRLSAHLEALTGQRYRLRKEGPSELAYVRPGSDHFSYVGVTANSGNLRKLTEAAGAMHGQTGLGEAQIVAHILADLPLSFPRARVDVQPIPLASPDAPPVARQQVVVMIRTPDLTLKELTELYQSVRWALSGQPESDARVKTQPVGLLTHNDRVLMEIVNRLGGIPEKGRSEFWRNAAKAWNDGGYPARGRKPNALRMQWARLEKKKQRLGPRSQGVPAASP